jgi:hypothetical protein
MEVPKGEAIKELKMEDEYECQPSTSSCNKEQDDEGIRYGKYFDKIFWDSTCLNEFIRMSFINCNLS